MSANNIGKGDLKSPPHSNRICNSVERRKRYYFYISTVYFILIILSGCFPCSKTFKEKDVLAHFGTDDTGITSLLNINGFFVPSDSTYGNIKIIFYTDGTMKCLPNTAVGDGVYKVSNDTLFAESFYYIGMNGGMQLTHRKYKIVDYNHIDLVSTYDNDNLNEELIHKIVHYQFVSSDSLPLPITYMKQKQWMWNDKTKWKSYMKQGYRKKYWE